MPTWLRRCTHNFTYRGAHTNAPRFLDCEAWRKDFKLDDLVLSFDYTEKAEVFKYYPQYYHKTDKDGRPLYIEQLGNIDLPAMYKITSAERMLQNLAVEYEKLADPRLPACSRKSGHLLETCCSILDLKGVGITKAPSVYGYIKSASAISQNYYPERLGKLYIINAPWGFSTIFGIIKGYLDPVTVEKIHVLGSGYQKELLSQVPAENLPKTFGGSCDCVGGCQLSDAGPWREAEFHREPKWAKKAKEMEAEAVAAPAADAPEQAAVPAPSAATSAEPPKEIPTKEYTDMGINPAPAQQ